MVGELPSLRTATSRTFARADGVRTTKVWAQPVNYRDAHHVWRPIDLRLARDASGGLRTTASATDLHLPTRLDEPARVADGSRWVRFALQGADPDATSVVSGSAVRYDEVVPHVDARYEAQSTGVKETLTLADAAAPTTYNFSLKASRGLVGRLRSDGAVVFYDRGGRARFLLPAPTVQEHGAPAATTDHVAYRLSKGGGRLTVAVDPAWLASASFPVQLDPSVFAYGTVACTLTSSTPTSSSCNTSQLKVGHVGGGSPSTQRAIVRFADLGHIDRTASVIDAELFLNVSSVSGTGSPVLDAYGLTTQPTSGASWNTYDGTHAWSTAGGALATPVQSTTKDDLRASGAAGIWDITPLAQAWLRDPTTANKGVLVRSHSETAANVTTFAGTTSGTNGPTLIIDWLARPGTDPAETYEPTALDANTTLATNVASGNLAVQRTDISLPSSTDGDLTIARTFNSTEMMDTTQPLPGEEFPYGAGWTWTVNGAGLYTTNIWPDYSRTVVGAGGAIYHFDYDPAKDTSTTLGYDTPDGIDADYTIAKSDGAATLAYRNGGPVWHYAESDGAGAATLTSVVDANGNTTTITYRPDQQVDQITAPGGRVLTFNYSVSGQLQTVTDATADTWTYGLTSSGTATVLGSFSASDGTSESYTYQTASSSTPARMTQITDNSGATTTPHYETSTSGFGRVTSINHAGQTTTYTYPTSGAPCQWTGSDIGKRVITRADTTSTTYCINKYSQISYDNAPPTATPSGDWHDATYVNGVDPHTITLAGVDAGVGIQRMSLEEVDGDEFAADDITCDPRATGIPTTCPHSASATESVDPTSLTEGQHTFRQLTDDYSGNEKASTSWNVAVDRTAPGAASGFVGYFDDTTNTADITWEPPADPALADGNPGSGTVSYTYRWRLTGGTWSGWIATGAPGTDLPSTHSGESFDLGVQAYDAVGNLGAGASATVVTQDLPDTSDCLAHDIGGYPASCIDDAERNSPMDDYGYDAVSLDPDTSPSASGFGGIHPLTTGPLHAGWHITVHEDTGTAHHTPLTERWATIRNHGGSWVIGEAHQGWQFSSDDEDDSISTTGSLPAQWYRGRVINPTAFTLPLTTPDAGPHSTGCGWIFSENATPDLNPDSSTACGLGSDINVMDIDDFTETTNCPPDAAIPVKPDPKDPDKSVKVAHCSHGTVVNLAHTAAMCADVGLTTKGHTSDDCIEPLGGSLPAHACVKWRYITSDNKWIMVSDETRPNEAGRWFFIPRASLAGRYQSLPNILTPGANGNCPGALTD